MTMIDQQFDEQDYELISRESCYEGFFALEKFYFRHKLFEGGTTNVVGREVFIRGRATCVLPYDPEQKKIVLLEQFRAGTLLSGKNPWLIELIAGIDEEGESSESVAMREAKEEAGLELLALEPMLDCFLSPGGATEEISLYCARVEAPEGGGVFGLDEEDEDIRVHLVDANDVAELLSSGQIRNAPAIMALQWFLLHRARLDRVWLGGTA